MGGIKMSRINGEKDLSSSQQIDALLSFVKDTLNKKGLDMSNVTMINLYIKDINEFKEINSVYKNYFSIKPPSRACIQTPILHSDDKIILELQGVGQKEKIDTIHIQSLSDWAPANIGPYSQSNNVPL